MQDTDESDSGLAKAPARAKKRRISRPPSEEPEENEGLAIGKNAFTKKLQKFKKSPQKKVQCMQPPRSPILMIVSNNPHRQETQANE